MKKIFLFIFALSFTNAFSQKNFDVVTKDCCECVQSIDTSLSSAEIESKMQKCILDKAMVKIDALMKELKIKEFNEDTGSKIGTEIGKRLLKDCPKFTELSVAIVQKNNKAETETTSGPKGTATGTIKRFETNEFTYIVIADYNGRESSYLWLHYFKNSESIQKNPNSFIGREITINWQEDEFYIPKANGYFKVKEILSVIVNQ